MSPTLVLASASPARLATLRAAGLDPVVDVSGVDESGVDEGSAAATATELARRKCLAVVSRRQDQELVLGCDSVLELDGQTLGKPDSAAQARERWSRMSGRTGVLHTGHALARVGTGATLIRAAATTVHFAHVDDDEIEAYVASGEPLHVAGAFTIDGLGGAFVRGVEGDHHAVVGVSLPLLREMVRTLGTRWTDLWTPR